MRTNLDDRQLATHDPELTGEIVVEGLSSFADLVRDVDAFEDSFEPRGARFRIEMHNLGARNAKPGVLIAQWGVVRAMRLVLQDDWLTVRALGFIEVLATMGGGADIAGDVRE